GKVHTCGSQQVLHRRLLDRNPCRIPGEHSQTVEFTSIARCLNQALTYGWLRNVTSNGGGAQFRCQSLCTILVAQVADHGFEASLGGETRDGTAQSSRSSCKNDRPASLT